MNNNLDEMLKEAPSLTLEPFAPADTAENSLLPVKEEETRVPEVVLTPRNRKWWTTLPPRLISPTPRRSCSTAPAARKRSPISPKAP